MKKSISILGLLLFLLITNQSIGQTILWSEDFEGVPNWTLSNLTGINDIDANIWVISDAEGGVAPPGCGAASNGNATLHVGCQGAWCLGSGAAYNAGDGGAGFIYAETHVRSQYNAAIVTTGQTNLSLNFDWIGIGEAGDDFATLQYSIDGGATWIDLQIMSGGVTCVGGQGQWANTIIALPAACENQADLRFGFNWQNSNNGAGTDPSFAVNDMELTTPSAATSVTADFTLNPTSPICEGTTITFTDISTASGTTINSWAWTFNGGDITTANTQGPHNITFNTAGTYDIDLTVGDGTVTDTKTISITVNAAANAGTDNTANVCNNGGSTTLDLNTLLSGADAGGTWTETSGTASGQFTAATGMFDGNGLTIGNTYTFDYTVTGTAPCPNDVSTMTITIIDCSAGNITADFTLNPTSPICEGTTITFTDVSTASGTTINSWAWTFNGGDITTANTQGPHNITFNTAGTYNIDLTVGDGTLTDTKTISITVNAAANAGADNTANVCNNGGSTTLDLNTLLSGADAGGTWIETSGTASGQFTAATGMFDGNGLTIGNTYTFDYSVTGTAPCPDDVSTMTITIIDCSAGNITADFNANNITICQGESITFTDASTATGTTINSWNWTFNSGTPGSAITQGPHNITYNTAGTFDVTLVASDGTLNDSKIIQVTVNSLPTVTANASPSTTICTGDPVTLTGGGATSYTWNNGVNDGVSFTPPVGSTTYDVIGTDGNNCTSSASVTINVADCVPMIAGFSFNDNICAGSCINFTDTTSGTPVSWSWDFSNGATPISSSVQNPQNICFNTPGVYQIQLTVTDAGGNSVSTTNSITVFDLPTVNAQFDTIIDLGGNVELEANSPNVGNYLWTPNTYYIDCDTCSSTFATPQLDEDYIVIFTDFNGCKAQDTVKVTVNFIEGIGVPQAFSPNNDGNNDLLVVKGLGIDKMNFKIYNRYGQLVFESNDQTHGWDGSFKGKPENPGVFVWVLEYKFLGQNNSKKLTGNTTLIR